MNTITYENYQEHKSHDKNGFPYNNYPCTIPLDFPNVPLHWQKEWEIVFFKKGHGFVSANLVTFQVGPGAIAVLPPGMLHSIWVGTDNAKLEYETILFLPELLVTSISDEDTKHLFHHLEHVLFSSPLVLTEALCWYPIGVSCLTELEQLTQSYPDGYPLGIKSELYRFFYVLYRQLPDKASNVTSCRNQHTIDKLKTILTYVDTHLDEKMSIETMACLADFSESHFMRFFKENMHQSFITYVNHIRLVKAHQLLEQSDDEISAIAYECGFDNLSYFNRLFKKQYGSTPGQLRR